MYAVETANKRVTAIIYKLVDEKPIFLVLELEGRENEDQIMLLTAKTYRGQGWQSNIIDCARKKLNLTPEKVVAIRALHGGRFDESPFFDGELQRYCCLLEVLPDWDIEINPKPVTQLHWVDKAEAVKLLRESHSLAFIESLRRAATVAVHIS